MPAGLRGLGGERPSAGSRHKVAHESAGATRNGAILRGSCVATSGDKATQACTSTGLPTRERH